MLAEHQNRRTVVAIIVIGVVLVSAIVIGLARRRQRATALRPAGYVSQQWLTAHRTEDR